MVENSSFCCLWHIVCPCVCNCCTIACLLIFSHLRAYMYVVYISCNLYERPHTHARIYTTHIHNSCTQLMHTHACTHDAHTTHTHSRIHEYIHTLIHTRTHTHAHTYAHTCTNIHIYTHASHTHISPPLPPHTHTHTQVDLMDHPLHTVTYVADIDNVLVIMAHRATHPSSPTINSTEEGGGHTPKLNCHILEAPNVSELFRHRGSRATPCTEHCRAC